jgi:hypothetical protein
MTQPHRRVARAFTRRAWTLAIMPLLLALAGCGDGGDTRVTVEYVPQSGVSIVEFDASLRAGQSVTAFAADAAAVPAPVLTMETPASGFVIVTAALVDVAGTVGGGVTAIPLRRDATISVKVRVDSLNPLAQCAECLGAKAFVLPVQFQRVATDSIWMVWSASPGGASITR